MENENTVYVVMLEWVTDDDQGIDYYIYKNYDGALNKFNGLIIDECDADISWVGSQVFDENGEVNEGFTLECNTNIKQSGNRDLFWKVSDDYGCRFSNITLTKKEIIGD